MKRNGTWIAWLVVALLSLASLAPSGKAQTSAEPLPLGQVRFLAYQIQALAESGSVEALANSRYDLLVIDPTRTDWSTNAIKSFNTRETVERLKNSPSHDGVALKRRPWRITEHRRR